MITDVKQISKELRKKYNLDENIIDLTIDVAFKKVLSMESNRWYLAFLISYCTKLDIKYILEHMEFKNDLISGKNLNKKTGSGDLIIEVNNKIINLEMNRKVTESLIRKNKWYVNTLASATIEKNSKINNKFIIQINISTKKRIPNTSTLMYEIVRMDRNLLVEDVYNSEIIYDINLEYLKKELYNKGKLSKDERRLLIFIEKNKYKLKEVYKGDVKMKETIDNMEEVSDFRDISFALEYDKEALDEQINKEWMEQEIKEGIEQGIQQGVKNTTIKLAKEMLKLEIPLEQVSKITNISIEELKQL